MKGARAHGSSASGRRSPRIFPGARILASLLVISLAVTPALAQRTKLKPGVNMFSVQQDVEIGAQNAAQVEKQYAVVNDARFTNYLTSLGKRLASKAPGPKFDYRFKLVNDRSINAFALPGGFLYVNRGLIEAADNEAQLAGVMGHEIGHAAMRHGTNQATKAQITEGLLGLAGAVSGGNTAAQLATQLGGAFTATSVLLKFSRDAERQSDIIGTQILYDNGYDPRAMAQFFEKLSAEGKKGRPPEFFSTHPNPENRSSNVMKEIERLGGMPKNARTDSAEFRQIKALVAKLPAPPPKKPAAAQTSGSGGPPPAPSSQVQPFEGKLLTLSFPQNWKTYGGQDGELGGVTLAPEGGIVQDANGNSALAYGVILGVYKPQSSGLTLEQATDEFIRATQQGNPKLRADRKQIGSLAGRRAMVVNFDNQSPTAGRELGRIVTVDHDQGMVYFISVSPEKQFEAYDAAFKAMLGSVRFRR